MTNLEGIVLSGSLVLLLLGVQPTRVQGRLARRTRIGIGATLALALALLVPLLASTRKAVTDATNVDDAQSAAESWATERDLELRRVSVEGDTVDVDVAGARPPSTIEPLARELAEDFNRPVRLTVGWTRQLVLSARADPDGRSTPDPTPPPRPETGPPPGPG